MPQETKKTEVGEIEVKSYTFQVAVVGQKATAGRGRWIVVWRSHEP